MIFSCQINKRGRLAPASALRSSTSAAAPPPRSAGPAGKHRLGRGRALHSSRGGGGTKPPPLPQPRLRPPVRLPAGGANSPPATPRPRRTRAQKTRGSPFPAHPGDAPQVRGRTWEDLREPEAHPPRRTETWRNGKRWKRLKEAGVSEGRPRLGGAGDRPPYSRFSALLYWKGKC